MSTHLQLLFCSAAMITLHPKAIWPLILKVFYFHPFINPMHKLHKIGSSLSAFISYEVFRLFILVHFVTLIFQTQITLDVWSNRFLPCYFLSQPDPCAYVLSDSIQGHFC